MARAPFQVLVFPFEIRDGNIRFALFRRPQTIAGRWEGISAGGEDGESPFDATQRVSFDEMGIMPDAAFLRLDTTGMIPVVDLCGFQWGPDVPLIPEHTYGVSADEATLTPMHPLIEVTWHNIDSAMAAVPPGISRTALWELYYRLRNNRALCA